MKRTTFSSLLFLAFLVGVTDSADCVLPVDLKNEILSYQNFVNNVIWVVTRGNYSGKLYNDLSIFADKFGSRMTGTQNLEESIDYLAFRPANLGLHVRKDPFKAPYWRRGKESAMLLSPRVQDIKILGLGLSVGTGPTGLTADVVVVTNFVELKNNAHEVQGKMVLFNFVYTNYSECSLYRIHGPAMASKYGAIAVLVRSATPFSIYSPHTGYTSYGKEKPIPAASVTLEDADMMARMYNAGQRVIVNIKMEARIDGDKTTNNLILDLEGHSLPQQYVTVSGHIDSWDIGQGVLDDGVGSFLALHSLFLMKFMNVPPPKRTLRAILWSAEELGLVGAHAYVRAHKEELKYWSAAMESDAGLYTPLGFLFNGANQAHCIIKEIMSLFKNLNTMQVQNDVEVGSDISLLPAFGVPVMEPLHGENDYMWFHHTAGDSMRTLNSSIIDENLALFSATAYILANLSIPLPRIQPKALKLH